MGPQHNRRIHLLVQARPLQFFQIAPSFFPLARPAINIALFRLCSKSTNVSEAHSFCRISSRVTTSPGFSSNMETTQKGCPGKRMRTVCIIRALQD